MNQAMISIIIPVYNGEKYIRRCLDSILAQRKFMISDLDILLIDDGSTDDSSRVINSYEQKHPDLIRSITQKNMGVAKTRNRGIELASGRYIMFIDQDDWVDPDYCHVFFDAIESSGADVVSGGYVRPDANSKIHQISSPNIKFEYSKYIIVAAWAKIHRTSFLRQNDILFFENKFGEDSVFTIKEINSTKKWKQIEYNGYNWFFNETSVSNTLQKKLGRPEVSSLLALLHALNATSGQTNNNLFQYYLLRTSVYYLLFSGRKATAESFMSAYQDIEVWINKNTHLAYLISFKPRGEVFSVKSIILMFVVFHKTGLMGLFAKIYCRG